MITIFQDTKAVTSYCNNCLKRDHTWPNLEQVRLWKVVIGDKTHVLCDDCLSMLEYAAKEIVNIIRLEERKRSV
jgi:hypothetical protein